MSRVYESKAPYDKVIPSMHNKEFGSLQRLRPLHNLGMKLDKITKRRKAMTIMRQVRKER